MELRLIATAAPVDIIEAVDGNIPPPKGRVDLAHHLQ